MAQVDIRVRTEGLPEELRPVEADIRANLVAAARAWTNYVDAKRCRIEIVFRIDPAANNGRGSGRSLVTARLGDMKHDRRLVSEQGWASEMRTGIDPNADSPDVEVVLHPKYVRTIWWDPQPEKREAPVPANKLDSMSVLLHEMGHALAFNGWMDPRTGQLPGEFISSYDRHVRFDGKEFTFVGPETVKLWGRPVALARNVTNYHHVGDRPLEERDSELKGDLMNGIVFEHGRRYSIGLLDLAILYDCGIPLKPVTETRASKVARPSPAETPTTRPKR
jgi:hypothetical protein